MMLAKSAKFKFLRTTSNIIAGLMTELSSLSWLFKWIFFIIPETEEIKIIKSCLTTYTTNCRAAALCLILTFDLSEGGH